MERERGWNVEQAIGLVLVLVLSAVVGFYLVSIAAMYFG